MTTITEVAQSLPSYVLYPDQDYDSDWLGSQLLKIWIAARKQLCSGQINHKEFTKALVNGVQELFDWQTQFVQACTDAGIKPNRRGLFASYCDLHAGNAFDAIPQNLHAELSWIPTWSGISVDGMYARLGIQSLRGRNTDLASVVPGAWLEVFLQLVNQSSAEVLKAARLLRGADGLEFTKKCVQSQFLVKNDPLRPSLMSPEQVITAIENAYDGAVPTFHCEVNVKALFQMAPGAAMRMTSAKGQVHLGFHEGFNGAGYMDSYAGEIVIPANAAGFLSSSNWNYGIDSVYGIVKSCFYTTPAAA